MHNSLIAYLSVMLLLHKPTEVHIAESKCIAPPDFNGY